MSDLCDCSDAYIVVKGTITVTDPNNNAHDKKLAFKNNSPLLAAFQKLIMHLLIMQRLRYCNVYVRFDSTQQKLFKDNRKFV